MSSEPSDQAKTDKCSAGTTSVHPPVTTSANWGASPTRIEPARYSFARMRPEMSGNSAAIASLAVQKLAGKEIGTEQAARAMYLFKPQGATAEQLLAEANRMADSAVGQAAKRALESSDSTRAMRIIANAVEEQRRAVACKKEVEAAKATASRPQPISSPIIIGTALFAAMAYVATSDNEPEIKAGSLIAITATLFIYGLIEWMRRNDRQSAETSKSIPQNYRPCEPGQNSRPQPLPSEKDSNPTRDGSNEKSPTEDNSPSKQVPKMIGSPVPPIKLPDTSDSKNNLPSANSVPSKAIPQPSCHAAQEETPAPPSEPSQDPPALAPPIPASPKTAAHHRSDLLDGNGQTIRPPFLWVGRTDLLEALRLINNVGQPRKTDQIILSFDGSFLHFDLVGMSTSMPAKGIWNCQVRAQPAFLLPLIREPLADDSTLIWAKDGRIYFGPSFSCPCEVQGQWQAVIQLPLNADDAVLLGVKLKYSAEEIEQSGLKDTVAKADQACGVRVAAAANALAQYGVSPDDIRSLVDQNIRESGLLGKI